MRPSSSSREPSATQHLFSRRIGINCCQPVPFWRCQLLGAPERGSVPFLMLGTPERGSVPFLSFPHRSELHHPVRQLPGLWRQDRPGDRDRRDHGARQRMAMTKVRVPSFLQRSQQLPFSLRPEAVRSGSKSAPFVARSHGRIALRLAVLPSCRLVSCRLLALDSGALHAEPQEAVGGAGGHTVDHGHQQIAAVVLLIEDGRRDGP